MRREDNPQNRFQPTRVQWGAPDTGGLDGPEPGPFAQLELHEEQAKSILSENDSPDLSFRFSLNPYRGCYHACAYCYARPSHQYWGFGAGTDFERKLVVKVNAASLLRARFERKDWQGERILFSGNTDCYQPLEAARKLTRACLEVCAQYKNPVVIITKNALVQRDLDVLCALHERAHVLVFVSIPFADDDKARAIEPGASAPSKRFAALAALSRAGIETGIAVAPIIPGLNDADVPELLERAKAAGASRAFRTLLRLPGEVAQVFESRLREAFPDSADKVMHTLVQVRSGKKNDSRFGERMHGHGPRWKLIDDLFELHCARQGLTHGEKAEPGTTFERPRAQLSLF